MRSGRPAPRHRAGAVDDRPGTEPLTGPLVLDIPPPQPPPIPSRDAPPRQANGSDRAHTMPASFTAATTARPPRIAVPVVKQPPPSPAYSAPRLYNGAIPGPARLDHRHDTPPPAARRRDDQPESRAPAPRQPELGPWAFAAVSVIAAIGVLTFCVLSIAGGLDDRTTKILDNAGQFSGGAAAALAGLWSWRRARGDDRTWRLLLALGAGGWTLGLCVWAWYQVVLGHELPSPSLADAGFYMLPLFALPALYLFPSRVPRTGGLQLPYVRLVYVLDSLIVVGSLFVLTWSTALGAAITARPSDIPAFLVALGYPVTDLLLAVFVVLLGSFRAPRNPLALLLLGLGLIGVSVSDSFFLYLVSIGSETMPPLYNIGFVLGPTLLALSLVAPNPWARRPQADGERETGRGSVLLPYVPLLVTATVLVSQVLRQDVIDRVEAATGLALVALVIGRQLLTLLDNHNLVRQATAAEARLHRQAYNDSLTGLANRALFRERLDAAVAAHREEHRPLALLFCDLDDFKFVNDRYGHAAGDELLQAVATRLRQCVRPEDTVARLGGDEFAVLLDSAVEAPDAVAARTLASLELPYPLSGTGPKANAPVTVRVGTSIGLVVLDAAQAPTTPDGLLARVDSAMYAAKRRGKNTLVTVRAADATGELTADDPAAMLGELRMAILAGGAAERHGQPPPHGVVDVMYQPVVRFRNAQVVALEALVRWRHTRHGTLPADRLVQAADECGMLATLEEHVLETACRDIRRLRTEAGFDDLTVHVNVSATRAGDPALVRAVRESLARHRLPGDALVLEVTETARVPDLTAAAHALLQLRDLGVKVALDDFGTGYSGLSYLQLLPIDVVKLDRSLTVAEPGTRSATIRNAATALTHDLGLVLIAEGVETVEQAHGLAAAGCELGQGYLYARPEYLPALDLTGALIRG